MGQFYWLLLLLVGIVLAYRVGTQRGRIQVRKEWNDHMKWLDEHVHQELKSVDRRWRDSVGKVKISNVRHVYYKEE